MSVLRQERIRVRGVTVARVSTGARLFSPKSASIASADAGDGFDPSNTIGSASCREQKGTTALFKPQPVARDLGPSEARELPVHPEWARGQAARRKSATSQTWPAASCCSFFTSPPTLARQMTLPCTGGQQPSQF